VVLGMVLLAMGIAAAKAATAGGTLGDGLIVVVEDDVVVLLARFRPSGTSVGQTQNYLQMVPTWPSSSSSPPHFSRHMRHPLG
jgi:hypothetical protein